MNVPPRDKSQAIVLIASESVLTTWSLSASRPTDLLVVSDVDDEHALAIVERRRPEILILEQTFAASARGGDFIRRLRVRPDLRDLDVRVLPAECSAMLGAPGPIVGHVLASLSQSVPMGPLRRAPRIAIPDETEI